jgi:thioredoxin-related protein
MKNIITSILISLVTISTSCAQESGWVTDIELAKTTAQKEGKAILMSFSGSDWCANCIRLDKTLFKNEDFLKYASNDLVLLKLDFPAKKKNRLSNEQTAHNEALAEKFNKNGVFPTTLILDENGKLLGPMTYPSSTVDAYVSSIKKLCGK